MKKVVLKVAAMLAVFLFVGLVAAPAFAGFPWSERIVGASAEPFKFPVPTGVVLAGFLLIGSLICNRVTDLLRKFDPDNKWPKALWILAPWGAGILLAVLVCNFDTFRTLAGLPADFSGCSGVLLTGMGLGSIAGFWHEVMDFFSSKAKEARTAAGLGPQV